MVDRQVPGAERVWFRRPQFTGPQQDRRVTHIDVVWLDGAGLEVDRMNDFPMPIYPYRWTIEDVEEFFSEINNRVYQVPKEEG